MDFRKCFHLPVKAVKLYSKLESHRKSYGHWIGVWTLLYYYLQEANHFYKHFVGQKKLVGFLKVLLNVYLCFDLSYVRYNIIQLTAIPIYLLNIIATLFLKKFFYLLISF